jgi:hypothetical protein
VPNKMTLLPLDIPLILAKAEIWQKIGSLGTGVDILSLLP